MMLKKTLSAGTLFLATALSAISAVAWDSAAGADAAYRLSVDQTETFRLHAAGQSAYQYRDVSAIPAQLADKPFATLIHNAARSAALDPALVHALIYVESGYNPTARSNKGAIGLMQVLPETAARYGVRDPGRSPEANLKAGTRYLSDLMQQFDGRLELVLAAYNAGENAVLNHGQQIPPYRETRRYVPAVLARYREWAAPPHPPRIEYRSGTRLEQ